MQAPVMLRIIVIMITLILSIFVIKNFIDTAQGATLYAGVIIIGFIAFRIIIHNVRVLIKLKNNDEP